MYKKIRANVNDGAGTVFTLGKPICGHDNISYDYVSFVVIQNHDIYGYIIKIVVCDTKYNSSNNYEVYNFRMSSGNVDIWYI